MKLNLGVIDVPYVDSKDAQTTGDVADILEAKYHVMEIFYEQHAADVVMPALESSVSAVFENVVTGAPPPEDIFAPGADVIRKAFDDFITKQEMDALGYPGVPTQAARDRESQRFKRPYNKQPSRPRPSFVDTGEYLDSFRAWVEFD
jgi:hypothetical protein